MIARSSCSPAARTCGLVLRGFSVSSVVVLLLFGATGCERLFDKGSKQDIETADGKVKSGDFQAAIKLYEASLDGSSKTADVHYKLALLYADKMNSPADAMHHFGRYLALAPAGPHSKEAKDYRQEGEQKLAASATNGSPMNPTEAARLKNQNLALQKLVADLRVQRAATPAPAQPGAKQHGEQVQKPIPPGGRTHVVAAKENLGMIAQKYYKNKTRWKEIQNANFQTVDAAGISHPIEGTATIRPGMTLYIP